MSTITTKDGRQIHYKDWSYPDVVPWLAFELRRVQQVQQAQKAA